VHTYTIPVVYAGELRPIRRAIRRTHGRITECIQTGPRTYRLIYTKR